MAGTAFLPWEKWFAWLVHKLAVAIDGPTEYNESGLCRVPGAGLRWTAQGTELLYASTRQMTKSRCLFNSLND